MIIQDIITYRSKLTPQNWIKLNHIFEKAGFKKVYLNGKYLSRLVYAENLTLIINPNYSDLMNKTEELANDNDFYNHISTYENHYYGYYNQLRDLNEEERIFINYKFNEGKNYRRIGVYLPLRNIVVLYLPLFSNSNTDLITEPEYTFMLAEFIAKWVTDEKNKVKVLDISDLMRKAVLKSFLKGVNSEISSINYNLDRLDENYQDYLKRMSEIIPEKRILENRLKSAVELANADADILDKRIEEIKTLPFVKNVRLEESSIKFEFDKIKVKDLKMGDYVEMGEFDISLRPNQIEIKNRNPAIEGGAVYHSLHIKGTNICFGAKSNEVMKMLATLELKKLVHFLYLYLKTYNPTDVYISMRRWRQTFNPDYREPSDEEEEEEEEEDSSYYDEEDSE